MARYATPDRRHPGSRSAEAMHLDNDRIRGEPVVSASPAETSPFDRSATARRLVNMCRGLVMRA